MILTAYSHALTIPGRAISCMFLLARSLKWYNFQQVLQARSGVKYLQTRRSFQTRKKGVCKLVAGRWHDKSSCEISGLGFSSTHSYVRIKSIVSGNLVATHAGLICCWLVSVTFMGFHHLSLFATSQKQNKCLQLPWKEKKWGGSSSVFAESAKFTKLLLSVLFPPCCAPEPGRKLQSSSSGWSSVENNGALESDLEVSRKHIFLSIRLLWSQILWSQQLSFVVFLGTSLVVLTFISQLYAISIDQLHELWDRWVTIQWHLSMFFNNENMYSQSS
jgi:hypothetical protein